MQRMKYREIFITLRRVYGMPVIYPACPDSRIFARIAGTKTITPQNLQLIKNLGFDISEKIDESTTLEDILK